MLLIPAIDIKEGRCVRLRQGRMDDATVFSDDPVAVAKRWVDAGARRLHVVDLDGAGTGVPANAELIGRIVAVAGNVPVQVGGGVRDEDAIQDYLSAGVRYVILGTRAVNAPHFVADVCAEYPSRILVALDARGGKVATDGWSKLSNHDVVDLAQQFQSDGIEGVIFTDIGRDGMMSGLNIEATVELAQALSIPVYASGGIANIEDVRRLCAAAGTGVTGAITGRAIYEGTLDFEAANEFALSVVDE